MNYEVYLISDLSDNPIYAGQGLAGIRAKNWLRPSRYKRFGQPVKIKYRVIVATKAEALDLEEKFIEKFNPPFNNAKRDNMFGAKHSEETKLKISNASRNRSSETRKKIGDAIRLRNLGQIRSEETRRKISETLKNKI